MKNREHKYPPNRLGQVRIKRGYTQEAFAEKVGMARNTIIGIEKRKQAFTDENKVIFAKVLNVEPVDLMEPGKIQILGYVGAGQKVYPIDDYAMGDGMDTIDRPYVLEGEAIGLIVKGDSMEPAYEEGDVIFYSRDQRGVPETCHYKQCVVQVRDGPIYIKKLTPSKGGQYYHLISLNPKHEDLIDQEIEWAAKILFVHKP